MKIFSRIICIFVVLSLINIESTRSVRTRRSVSDWWNTIKDVFSTQSNQVKPEIECLDYSADLDCLGDLVDDELYEKKTVFVSGCPAGAKKDKIGRCRKILKSRN
jgi:hypothetical protein